MSDYLVGYRKPPRATRFQRGTSGNPKGRPKRQSVGLADIIDRVLGAPITFRERGRTRSVTREELALKTLIAAAMKGDVGAADHILKLYAYARQHGDTGVTTIRIENWLPDHAAQAADQKAETFAGTEPAADPTEWWNDPKAPPTHSD